MEKDLEISEEKKELIDIITSVVSSLKISGNEKVNISFKDAIKKINSFNVDNENKELKHFAFFVKNLFIGKSGSFDLDSVKLKKILSEDAVKSIFEALIECIESKTFLDFLLQLGEIFSQIYFKNQIFRTLIKEYENTGINNYEILFHIFSKCKECKKNEYISGNYDIYYFEAYSMSLSYDLIKANNAYIELCISSPKFDNLLDFISEEDNSTDSSNDKTKRINEIEKYIYESLISFLCNSQYLHSIYLYDFVLIFFDFVTQGGYKNFILNNKMNDHMKMFLEYMSFHLEKLFNDFREDSLYEFKISLYHFLDSHKNEKIKFVERALSIGKSFSLSEEEIGLISILCANHKYIREIENLAQEKAQQISAYSKEELKQFQIEERLSNEGLLILLHIIDEKKKEKLYCEKSNQPSYDNYKADEDKLDLRKKTNQQTPDPKSEINQSKSKLIKKDSDDDPKYQQLLSIIDNMNEQYNKDKEHYNKTISSLNKEIKDLNNDISNIKKENSKLNQNIERLNNIHRLIYFRDVSKFYIRQFAQTYKIDGESTFHICQNIMNIDFSKSKAKHLKQIITKISTHYLNGN